MVLYFYPMTGRPDRPLPDNWNNIPGAKGCTIQNCSFRDKYDEIITLNAVPIGISSQSVNDNKEMTSRLKIPYDVLSDDKLELSNALNIPTFSVNSKFFLKRITLIVEKKIIKKVFYPINDINKHIEEVLKWLKEN
jgi:peroxiredoxin